MRFTIFLTLCAIGVASASSLNKRSFIDDIQNQTQNAFHAFEEFSEQAKHNAEEGLKKLLDFFSQFNPQSDSSNAVNVTKRAVTGADLLANIGNPQKAQELLIQLFFESYGKGRKKRDLAENIQKLTGQAKKNAEENLKKLFDWLNQINPQSGDSSNAVNVTKRAVTGADLLANIGNPQKAQELLIQLFFESYGKGRKRRDLAENIQKLTGQAKKNAEENLKKLFDWLNQINPQSGDSSNAVNVTKRAVTGADLLANIGNPQKAQELLIQLFFESYGKGRKRRDLAENIQKLTGQAKQNAEANLKKLFDFFSQFNPQSVDSSNAVNVNKRAVTGADLLANIGNPQKVQELLTQLFFESYGKGR